MYQMILKLWKSSMLSLSDFCLVRDFGSHEACYSLSMEYFSFTLFHCPLTIHYYIVDSLHHRILLLRCPIWLSPRRSIHRLNLNLGKPELLVSLKWQHHLDLVDDVLDSTLGLLIEAWGRLVLHWFFFSRTSSSRLSCFEIDLLFVKFINIFRFLGGYVDLVALEDPGCIFSLSFGVLYFTAWQRYYHGPDCRLSVSAHPFQLLLLDLAVCASLSQRLSRLHTLFDLFRCFDWEPAA